ncbi:hypothetical protein PHYBOEH_009021 [Phytophthora boehmeriae]|uniref:Uncharacterized protein n=1 Tax=Phytophthora boehmeriae TaxID=109152 RepID=A0A8T1X662_9STRA|nr:hypothetical protein PHYBOEH_009021 [Phytophthora boehmeriae]
MYAWYFPKGFSGPFATRRHDWANVIVWIDNPALDNPSITGLSASHGEFKYKTAAPAPKFAIYNSTPNFYHCVGAFFGPPYMDWTIIRGNSQDLIMWEQLTEEARTALNTTDFGKATVPFIDANFEENLEKAWPF